ncbi:hypothetical [Yersinia pestis KIM10+]|uniref:Uncharacterized protein n=1 Tax=Yersinia pestis TaxID=632 RepID=Q8CLF0_YERPE|nr:hypothetical [Yersinia pestis KIM10+]
MIGTSDTTPNAKYGHPITANEATVAKWLASGFSAAAKAALTLIARQKYQN